MEKQFKNWDAIGTLRVGTSITIGTHILPMLIRRYQQDFPDLKVEAVISKSRNIEQDLLDGRVDIGLIETQPEAPDLLSIPFMKDSLCAIVAPDHPLAQMDTVSLTQLARYPFLMREKGSAGREILDACFSMLQQPVHPAWESASTQAIVRGVAEGLGVAVLPFLLVERDIREQTVRMLPLTRPLWLNLNIIYHKNKFLTPNMKAFIELCRDYGKAM